MIHLKPDIIFYIFGIPITNTLFSAFLTVIFLLIFLLSLRLKLKPSKIQILLEIFYENIFNFWSNIVGYKNKLLFTFCLSFLVYIALANILILFPLFDSIFLLKENEKIHLFRSPFSDLNLTLALAIISVFFVNFFALYKRGFKFVKKFLSPIGILELISEFAKIISFSFRLFGNILAGKILISVISILVIFLLPSFFIGIEFFVGLIQAFVFFMLTTVFLKVAIEENH
jgi:F-type H+-transporting ATPase subunit a